MKKLFFLLAGALACCAVSAQNSHIAAAVAANTVASNPTQIVRAGFCPEHYEGYLCGVFVTIEIDKGFGEIVRLVDPQPHVFQIRSDNDWVEITDQVLIDSNVWFEPQGEYGILHCAFTYQYPGGERQTFSIDLDAFVGGVPV